MYNNFGLEEVNLLIRGKKVSSVEVTKELFSVIKEKNPKLNAYITLTEDFALKKAKDVDDLISKGKDVSFLAGVPMGIKDIFNTKGVATTCCSNMLKRFVPPYNATVVDKLEEAGAVIVGKLNMDEFACGSSTEHSCFGPSRNPYDLSRVPGGSSGGSASAVAGDLSFYSLGTDTGGSIRQPASFSGIVGLKVTYGLVSRSGVTAMASSFDTVGPMTKTVRDAGIVLNVIAGRDVKDSTTLDNGGVDYLDGIEDFVEGLKIGIPKEFFGDGVSDEVRESVMKAVKVYESLGVTVKEVSLPYSKYAVALYYVSMPAELSANLARFDGIRYGGVKSDAKDLEKFYYDVRSGGFGEEIKRRVIVGTYVLSAGYGDEYYKMAQKVRTLIIQDFNNVFKEVDVLMSPVSPVTAFKLGEKLDDPLSMYLADQLTIPVSAAGLPAISLPCGVDKDVLPIGLQIIGPQLSEAFLLRVARMYEKEVGIFHELYSPSY